VAGRLLSEDIQLPTYKRTESNLLKVLPSKRYRSKYWWRMYTSLI